eukprot:4885955-Amphidinium_carterae.1
MVACSKSPMAPLLMGAREQSLPIAPNQAVALLNGLTSKWNHVHSLAQKALVSMVAIRLDWHSWATSELCSWDSGVLGTDQQWSPACARVCAGACGSVRVCVRVPVSVPVPLLVPVRVRGRAGACGCVSVACKIYSTTIHNLRHQKAPSPFLAHWVLVVALVSTIVSTVQPSAGLGHSLWSLAAVGLYGMQALRLPCGGSLHAPSPLAMSRNATRPVVGVGVGVG